MRNISMMAMTPASTGLKKTFAKQQKARWGALERTAASKTKQLMIAPADSATRAKAAVPPCLLERGAQDRELLRRIAAGENGSCAELYQRFSAPLFAKIFFIVGNASDAEDVMQETFVHVWKRVTTYDSARGNVFSWVMMIARSKALDRWRAQQRYLRATSAAEADISAALSAPLPNGNAVMKRIDDRYRILVALKGIARNQRAAIILCFFNGMTQAEISTQLGQPLGTVKAQIRRGLLALRKALEEKS